MTVVWSRDVAQDTVSRIQLHGSPLSFNLTNLYCFALPVLRKASQVNLGGEALVVQRRLEEEE